MKTAILAIVFLAFELISQSPAFTASSSSNTSNGLKYKVLIYADDELVDYKVGIHVDTKHLRFEALIDTTANDFSKEFLPVAQVEQAKITLARNSRQIASITWHHDRNLTAMIGNAQPGDRSLFVFKLVAKRKDGKLFSIAESPLYTVPLYK